MTDPEKPRPRPCRECITPILRAEFEGRSVPDCPHTDTEDPRNHQVPSQPPPIALNDDQALTGAIERAFGQKVNTTGSI